MMPLRFTLWGFPAEIGTGFLGMLCLCMLWDKNGMLCPCILAAGLHELAHLYAMYRAGWDRCRVRFTPLGIRLLREGGAPVSYTSEIAVHLSGPAVNLLLGGVLAVLAIVWDGVGPLMTANLGLGLFNLLPVCPLDGGHALTAALDWVLPPRRARLIANGITGLVLFPLASAAFLGLFRQEYNITLLLVVSYLMIFFVMNAR
jgi:stage IV sporulation protein FB